MLQVISKGGKLPAYARRIEAEEARESGRRPGDSVGQGRLVKALADSERAPSVVLRTVTGWRDMRASGVDWFVDRRSG